MAEIEHSHKKILNRLSQVSSETNSLFSAVQEATHSKIEEAVAAVSQELEAEKRARKVAESALKRFRERSEEWRDAMEAADERVREASKLAKSCMQSWKKVSTLKRAKDRVHRLESERVALGRGCDHRTREVALAEEAAGKRGPRSYRRAAAKSWWTVAHVRARLARSMGASIPRQKSFFTPTSSTTASTTAAGGGGARPV